MGGGHRAPGEGHGHHQGPGLGPRHPVLHCPGINIIFLGIYTSNIFQWSSLGTWGESGETADPSALAPSNGLLGVGDTWGRVRLYSSPACQPRSLCHTYTGHSSQVTQHQLRYIEWKGVQIYDFQKATFSTLFKLYIAGLGVLIPKRYHMLG